MLWLPVRAGALTRPDESLWIISSSPKAEKGRKEGFANMPITYDRERVVPRWNVWVGSAVSDVYSPSRKNPPKYAYVAKNTDRPRAHAHGRTHTRARAVMGLLPTMPLEFLRDRLPPHPQISRLLVLPRDLGTARSGRLRTERPIVTACASPPAVAPPVEFWV